MTIKKRKIKFILEKQKLISTKNYQKDVTDLRKFEKCYFLLLFGIPAKSEVQRTMKTENFVDLKNFMKINRECSRNEKVELIKQATQGLTHLHNNNIIHSKIHPKTIFVSKNSERDMILIIADGSKDVRYVAPEILNGEKPTKSSDIFALGCTFHEILHEKHPFGIKNVTENIVSDFPVGQEVGGRSFMLISEMICSNPDNRICLTDIEHNYFFWSSEKCLDYIDAVNRSCMSFKLNNSRIRNINSYDNFKK